MAALTKIRLTKIRLTKIRLTEIRLAGQRLREGTNMSVFDERPVPAAASKAAFKEFRLREMLAVILLAAVAVVVTHHFERSRQADYLRQTLRQLRGEAPADPGPNLSMDSSLTIRGFLLYHPHPKLSAGQAAALVASVAGPPDDQAQSEALDVLGLAKRANALSPEQVQKALAATLSVLRGSPGPMTRLESARLLGHLRDTHGAPALNALGRDGDPKVQSAAREALAHLQN